MTGLKDRIAALVAAAGPIPVSQYVALCLYDPDDGYYMTREPFGREGDFVTAPEISQMFGELVAVWLLAAWQALGRPLPVVVAEIGAGRGTLMRDMLRTFSRLDPALAARASFAIVETSPRLARLQKAALAGMPAGVAWHEEIDTLPRHAPLMILGNELFDAIPVRQFVRAGDEWRERLVGVDDQGRLRFAVGVNRVDPALLPEKARAAPSGAIVELAPARTALMSAIAARIAADGGAGLFLDYGHLEPGIGDTLQAVRRHRPEDVLENPGEADLTAHVDFAALAGAAKSQGLKTHLTTQGEFLLAMGLVERAGRLGANADAAEQGRIEAAVERLAGEDAMGTLFKVLAILPGNVDVPPFVLPGAPSRGRGRG
jgi:SAM-dependent MidA family methyltransferase